MSIFGGRVQMYICMHGELLDAVVRGSETRPPLPATFKEQHLGCRPWPGWPVAPANLPDASQRGIYGRQLSRGLSRGAFGPARHRISGRHAGAWVAGYAIHHP